MSDRGRGRDREDGRDERDAEFSITPVSPGVLPGRMGAWDVMGNSGRRYRVTIYDPDGQVRDCECPDFRQRKLGTCKHVRAVLAWIDARPAH